LIFEEKVVFLIRKLNVIADHLNYNLEILQRRCHLSYTITVPLLTHTVAWMVIRADRKQLAGLPLAKSASFLITPAGAMKHKETWATSWFSNVPIWKRTSHATL